MRIEDEIKLDYSDVLIRPKRSTLTTRKEVDLIRKFRFKHYMSPSVTSAGEYEYAGIPIMAANMDGVGTFEMADKLGKDFAMFTCLTKAYTQKELVDFFILDSHVHRTEYVAMTIGISPSDYDKFVQVYARVGTNLKYLCVDVANGYTETFAKYIQNIRNIYPHIVLIAGNVVTADQTQQLILAGADIVKIGIGQGSACSTRIVTGVGYPQLSAVIECADAAHGLGGLIIADGGCTCPGDVAKAIAAGADFVMLGGMLAGHKEGGGKIISKWYQSNEVKRTPCIWDGKNTFLNEGPLYEEKQFVLFYGMSSDHANKKHFGGLKDYRASEGRETLIPYKGDVENTVQTITGGLRSTCTYVGANKLKDLSKCATFIRVNNQYNRVYEQYTVK